MKITSLDYQATVTTTAATPKTKTRHTARSDRWAAICGSAAGGAVCGRLGGSCPWPAHSLGRLPLPTMLRGNPETCAAVEAAEKPTDAADAAGKTGYGDVITASFEAAQLFHDDGRQRLMPGLRDQRKIRQFCDVTFRAADGAEIWAHRFVLAARYSGCYALFTLVKEGTSPEKKQKEVLTPPIRVVVVDLDSDMVELLVAFAYHTPLHERIGLHNVAKALELAERLKVWKNSAQFQALTPEEMCSILEDDRLHAPNEVEETFRAILKWISADVDERKAYLAKFLPLVRFARCSVTDIENVVTTPQILGDGDSMKVLNVIHQTLSLPSMAVGEVAGVDLSPKLWLKPRLPKNILFLFGGWTVGATNKMLTYYCRAAKWRMMGKQNTTPRAYHGVAVIGQCIYFVGGFNGRECYHSVACFDLSLARWSTKANMAKARCYVIGSLFTCVVLSSQGHIYAMGGFDGHMRTNTVERYEVNTNQWSMVANMNDIRSDASAAVVGGRIYIVGGFTGQEVLDTVECYDPSTNVWTRVLTMSSPRSGLKVVAHKDSLYIIGGYNGTARLSSMEQLDVRRARCSDLPSMPHTKSNFAAVVLEGCIYAIGGFNGKTTVPLVERYDIAARKWYMAPGIGMNCSASAACIVHDVANPDPPPEELQKLVGSQKWETLLTSSTPEVQVRVTARAQEPETCAAVEATEKSTEADNTADNKTGYGDMMTAAFEAAQLFHDGGRHSGFAPGAAARFMPELLEQRKMRQFCDVVFQAANGAETWAHRFVLAAK
ncbi:hypothetical protein HPB49_014881 [Dermacentor silvarum]|uniref:Uncharacterized protein n=1 Tax=Dermacentor silvarum TaxID=543639 RepID=A0ACB8CFW2_DERSI|nr:hypothetical protein HPB49_014881 [Dermacentor silvarum]